MYQAGKGRRGLKGLGKIKVGSSKRHGEHVHGEEAAGGPPSDGDADLPSDSGGSDSDSGSGSDSDSDSSGALSDDLNVINAVEEPPEEDEAEVVARRARIRDRLRARDQAIAAEGGAGGGGGGSGSLPAGRASAEGPSAGAAPGLKARGTLGPAVDGMALPAAPLTMSGLRELKGRLTGKPAHRPGRRSDDSDTDDDSDSDGPTAAKAKAAGSGTGINAGRHFRTGSSTSASSTSGSSESESEEDEVMLRPVFRPKVCCDAHRLCWQPVPFPVQSTNLDDVWFAHVWGRACELRSNGRRYWSEKSWRRLRRPRHRHIKQRCVREGTACAGNLTSPRRHACVDM
jgi:hypothetical protein